MDLLMLICAVVFVCWVLGFALSFGGGLIHLLLVVCVVLLLIRVMRSLL
jgi:hypothetical protein